MTAAHQAALALGCLLCSAGAAAAGLGLSHSPRLIARVRAYESSLASDLRYLQLEVAARRLCAVQVAVVAGAVALAIAALGPWPLLAAAAAAFGPKWWLVRNARARSARIETQLDGWLLVLSNSLRANPALGAAIAASAELVAPPLSSELAVVEHEQRLGTALDHALRRMAARVGSPQVGAALAILRIARATGGDLSRTLEAAAASLREMARLEGVVRSKTAEGRAQTAVIAVAPIGLCALLHQLDAQLLSPLWSTAVGHAIVAAAVVLWAAALLLARRIVAVDV
jgi:tight adherence protein B